MAGLYLYKKNKLDNNNDDDYRTSLLTTGNPQCFAVFAWNKESYFKNSKPREKSRRRLKWTFFDASVTDNLRIIYVYIPYWGISCSPVNNKEIFAQIYIRVDALTQRFMTISLIQKRFRRTSGCFFDANCQRLLKSSKFFQRIACCEGIARTVAIRNRTR